MAPTSIAGCNKAASVGFLLVDANGVDAFLLARGWRRTGPRRLIDAAAAAIVRASG